MKENADVLEIELVIEELSNKVRRESRSLSEDLQNDEDPSINDLEGPCPSAGVSNLAEAQSVVYNENTMVDQNEPEPSDNKMAQPESQNHRGRLPVLRRNRPIHHNHKTLNILGQGEPGSDKPESINSTRSQDIQETVQQIRNTMDRISQRLKAIAPDSTKLKLSKTKLHSHKNTGAEEQPIEPVVEPEGLDQDSITQNAEANVEENQRDNAIGKGRGIPRRLATHKKILTRTRTRTVLKKTRGKHPLVTAKFQTTQSPQEENEELESTTTVSQNDDNSNNDDLMAEEMHRSQENIQQDEPEVNTDDIENTPVSPIED